MNYEVELSCDNASHLPLTVSFDSGKLERTAQAYLSRYVFFFFFRCNKPPIYRACQKFIFFYFMLSGRISRNNGKNIFRYYTGSTSEIPIFMFLLPRLIARASKQDGNMTSFTLHFSRLM